MSKQYLTTSVNQTKKLAKIFAQKILKGRPKKQAIIIGLIGDLGSGKTTFLQGFAKGLGIREKILSPTFIILKKFQIPNYKFQTNSKFQIPKFQTFYHIDCYRIQKSKEISDLGFKEVISSPQNLVAIEWADKIKKILPKNVLWIHFEFVSRNIRKIWEKKD